MIATASTGLLSWLVVVACFVVALVLVWHGRRVEAAIAAVIGLVAAVALFGA